MTRLIAIALVLSSSSALAEDSFRPLFNGKDLSGWYVFLQKADKGQDPEKIITIEDGAIHAYKHHPNGVEVPMGYIGTNEQYADYHLRVTYKWGKKQFKPRYLYKPDAGIYYHHVTDDLVWPQAMQCQVELNGVGDILTVGLIKVDTTVDPKSLTAEWQQYLPPDKGGVPYTTTGAGVSYTRKSDNFEHDGWNTVELICKGGDAVQIVNGHVVSRCSNIRRQDPSDPNKWIPLTGGRILLEFEATEMWYKDIEIRSLGEDETLDQAIGKAARPAPGEARGPETFKSPVTPGQALKTFQLPDSFTIDLVAAEPLVEDPVAVAWDEQGRMFVAEMRDYPNKPGNIGRIKLLTDEDRDGRMDRSVVFAQDLAFPNSVLPWNGGVLVSAAPDILFLKDTDGDGAADERRVVVTGFVEGNQQLRVNGLKFGLDGWVYGANGRSNGSLRRPTDPPDKAVPIVNTDFRFRPETGEVEPASGFSQFGLAFDEWGNRFISWNTIHIRHVVLERKYVERNPHAQIGEPAAHIADADHGDAGRVFPIARVQVNFHSEPAGYFNATSGIEIDRGGVFPAPYAGSAFVGEPLRNVVHRDELVPHGATFAARRGEHEKESEFLASTDPWFRPVNMATGPDGCLYIVDYYREWIEHPAFVPDEHEPGIDFYNGTDKGRIYRVRPAEAKPQAVGDLGAKSSEELVAALGHTNGWARETARRLLVERNDKSVVEKLAEAAGTSPSPHARLFALATLDGLKLWDTDIVGDALSDAHPRVREHGVRLSERHSVSDTAADPAAGTAAHKPLKDLLARMVDDEDPRVRFQLAATLGDADPSALVKIARRDLEDPWTQAAILSGLQSKASAFLNEWVAQSPRDSEPEPTEVSLLVKAAGIVAATDKEGFKLGTPSQWARPTPLGLRTLAIYTGLGHGPGKDGPVAALAGKLLGDPGRPVHIRQLAATLLSRGNSPDDLRRLVDLLNPQTPTALQQTVVESLGRVQSPEVPQLLLARWANATQPVRRLIVQSMFATVPGTEAVLGALEGGQIAATEMEFLWRYQLLHSGSEAIRKRAESIFKNAGADRTAVIEKYRPALSLAADPAKGETLFTQHCTVCHKVRGTGGAVGPDLSAIASRTNQQLLEDILDPNRQVSPDFIGYAVVTKDGQAFVGTIAAENAHQITLRQLDGREATVARENITTLQSTGQTLMPVGFEATLTPQDFADLLTYLRGG